MATKQIYKIINLDNNKVYIGKTIKPLEERLQEHIRTAKRWQKEDKLGKAHPYNSRLYPAMNKHGYDRFKIELVENVSDVASLEAREQYWIDKFNSTDDAIGYNISPGGMGGALFSGHKHTAETKAVLRQKSRQNIKLDKENLSKRQLPRTSRFQKLATGEILLATDFKQFKTSPAARRAFKQNFTTYKVIRIDGEFYICLNQRRNACEPLSIEDCQELLLKLTTYWKDFELDKAKVMRKALAAKRAGL